jgi:hypothetical protein
VTLDIGESPHGAPRQDVERMRIRPDFCRPHDPESRGLVGYAKRDLPDDSGAPS